MWSDYYYLEDLQMVKWFLSNLTVKLILFKQLRNCNPFSPRVIATGRLALTRSGGSG